MKKPARFGLSFVTADDGLVFKLSRSGVFGLGKAEVPYPEWTGDEHPGVGLLKLLASNEAADIRSDGVLVSHPTVACMSASETGLLGLPQRCPYALRLESRGSAVSDAHFRIEVSWIGSNGDEAIGLRRTGAILGNAVEHSLICEPLYSLLEELESFNRLGQGTVDRRLLDERMVQFKKVKFALEIATGDAKADTYLDGLTIHHATGLAIEAVGAGDTFEPVLYGDVADPLQAHEQEDVQVERRPLLPGEHALKFRTVLFPVQGARSHYRLAEGVYAIADAPVHAALGVVERVNRSDAATRAAFKANPRSFLIEEIEKAGGGGDILCEGSVLREPMDYGERVLGVRLWDGKGVTFKVPVYHNWFPKDGEDVETYVIDVPGAAQPLVLRPAEVSGLRDAVERARAVGHATVEFNGRTFPLTPDFEQTVSTLVGHVSPDLSGKDPKAKKKDAASQLLVLRAADNEEDLVFNARLRDPKGLLSRSEEQLGLKTTPKPHQVDGISWLRHAFLSGMPGVLLADDMGLGKTYQVLAFLNWLRTNDPDEARPTLVVAPKKLLDVWRDEVQIHLGAEGLGRPVFVYDEHLAALKVGSAKEGKLGSHTLDVDALRKADWVLTTYETLRDYHFSFAKVRFRAAVFDEAQKMKSMASLINNAAKCQQPDFAILMTGTPIENSVMDLWTLMDIAWPGFLGLSGKEFAKTYGEDVGLAELAQLKSSLIEPISRGERLCPPVMLRRFKSAVLPGLPKKVDRPWRVQMSADQARAYDAVLSDQASKKVGALQALQALRAVTFHPNLRMPRTSADHQDLIAQSARFQALFEILDGAFRTDERVLVFVDLREGQRVLGALIRTRYRMLRSPQVINGDTSTKSLSVIKTDFQNGKSFDVLLLGPRAAGFGLTLTAANHVVHMNRWWNPAVEDQCSDRVYRLGQTKEVTVYLPIAVHPQLGDASFDVVLDTMLAEKRSLSREIVVPTTMTEQDFRAMFATLVGGGAVGERQSHLLDTIGWKAFEDWTADQFASVGYQPNKTPRSGDAGADLIMRPPPGQGGRPIICQCKHRSRADGQVDDEAVRDVLRARSSYETKYPWLKDPILVAVSNGSFTLGAIGLAREKGVILVGRTGIDGLAGVARSFLENARHNLQFA